MPIPKTTDISKIIEFLNKEKPNMPRKQKVAIALQIRRSILKKRSKENGRRNGR